MPIVYALLALLGLVVLLMLLVLFVPVGVRVIYDGELRVRVRVFGVPVTVLPSEDSSDKPVSPETAKKPSKSAELKTTLASSFREDGVGATLAYLGKLAALAGRAVGDLLRAIVVDTFRLDLLIAAVDPQDTAVRYGQVCGVLYPAIAAIEQKVIIRRREWRVEPNFLRESSAAYVDIRAHVWVYRVAGTAIKLLAQYWILQINKPDDKGGFS